MRRSDDNLPHFNKNEELHAPGEYKHLNNRNKSHIGILIDKPHHEKTIEVNKLYQWHVDTTQGEHEKKTQLCQKMIEELTKDTLLKRTDNLKIAFQNMIATIDASEIENGHVYKDILIVVNPVMSSDDEYVESAVKMLTSLAKREIIHRVSEKNMNLGMMKIILLDYSEGHTCSDYYTPDKDIVKNAKEKV